MNEPNPLNLAPTPSIDFSEFLEVVGVEPLADALRRALEAAQGNSEWERSQKLIEYLQMIGAPPVPTQPKPALARPPVLPPKEYRPIRAASLAKGSTPRQPHLSTEELD
ncbi:hypothetical protein [Spirulina subsalsa]|uniref:hypothetical protein n=1 Tax=Spirulina subsalsa TaxID=54311 RepID=UPI0002F65383|nr:hypothetical protein [Spirulina subsalsa]